MHAGAGDPWLLHADSTSSSNACIPAIPIMHANCDRSMHANGGDLPRLHACHLVTTSNSHEFPSPGLLHANPGCPIMNAYRELTE